MLELRCRYSDSLVCFRWASLLLHTTFLSEAFLCTQERAILYRRYTTLHLLVTLGAFSVAAVWIALSAARHSQAKSGCQTRFFSDSTEASEANTLCDIFPWVDVGIMAGLWVLLAVAQVCHVVSISPLNMLNPRSKVYFYVVLSSYGTGQRLDHEKYDSMYDPTRPLTADVALNNRDDPWDARHSDDIPLTSRYEHGRGDSFASVDTITADKPQGAPYDPYGGASYPSEPGVAYTQEPYPTPHVQDPYYSNSYAGGSMSRPEMTQPHPGA